MSKNRKDAIQTKIQILRKRHDRWLHGQKSESRLAESKNENKSEPLISENRKCENTSIRNTVISSCRSDTNDDFLSKLSRKIATQIRNELNLQSSVSPRSISDRSMTLVSHMEDLSPEIQTHVCPICHELMSPPEKTPMLLFPCGHTFCAMCAKTYTNNLEKDPFSCPSCNREIVSMAENQSLRYLIEKAISQEATGGRTLDKILRAQFLMKENITRFSGDQARREIDDNEMKRKFETEYRDVAMRHKIISNEFTELMKKRK